MAHIYAAGAALLAIALLAACGSDAPPAATPTAVPPAADLKMTYNFRWS